MINPFQVSVVLPTLNPHPGRLARALSGLDAQTLPRDSWELLAVDNGSAPPLSSATQPLLRNLAAKILIERRTGLTPARLAGIRAARGDIIVFMDDDNVLSPGYLASVARRFTELPSLAAAGGPVLPDWESPPPEWTREFHGLLALRERTEQVEIAHGGPGVRWPAFAPVGAGLAIRRSYALKYADAVERDPRRLALDRSGNSLASGGDNDLVFSALHAGGDVAYFPELRVTHVIPASRLEARYLAKLNRGIMRTWVRVLHFYGQCPWPAIARWTVPLRYIRASLRRRSLPSPARSVVLAGLRGQFEGQADIATQLMFTR
jgi:glycosyltransferase involved in cell wall biosynthesis